MQTQQALTEPSHTSSSAVDPVLLRVDPKDLSIIAEAVLPMIESVVARSRGRWTLIAVLRAIYEGQGDLWAVWDGQSIPMIVGTEIYTELSGRKYLGIRFATGAGAKQYVRLIGPIEDYARANGCAAVDGWMRKGWAKHLPDYHMSHVLLEKDI